MPTRKTTILTILALCAAIASLTLRTRAQVDGAAGAGGNGIAGQGGAVAPVPPKQTQLEKLANQAGVLVIKGYTVIGELTGDDGSNVRVSAVQFTDAANRGNALRGLVVQVREANGNREAISYVDADEIDGLISAVDSLANLQQTDTPLQEFEGRYATRAEFEVANVNVGGGRIIGVRSVQFVRLTGQLTWASGQFRVSRMREFGQLLTNAKRTLDGLANR